MNLRRSSRIQALEEAIENRKVIDNIWINYSSNPEPIPDPRTMMSFIINPYEQTFDLTDRAHLKLYTDGCQGLAKEVKFDGKRENYGNFVKLIGKIMDARRIKGNLKIATTWETTGTIPELPNADGMQDLFNSNSATEEQVDEHCRLVWSEADFNHADSAKLLTRVVTKPVDINTLNAVRNKMKLKHAMLRAMIWDSCVASYQLEIIGDEDKFKMGLEYDGVKLWYYI